MTTRQLLMSLLELDDSAVRRIAQLILTFFSIPVISIIATRTSVADIITSSTSTASRLLQ